MLDRIGIFGSALCALHCAALPLLLISLPASALAVSARGSWEHTLALWVTRLHGYERALVVAAVMLAALSMMLGWRRHRRLLPTMLALPAVLILVCVVLAPIRLPLAVHFGLPLLGGILLMLAHAANLHAARHA